MGQTSLTRVHFAVKGGADILLPRTRTRLQRPAPVVPQHTVSVRKRPRLTFIGHPPAPFTHGGHDARMFPAVAPRRWREVDSLLRHTPGDCWRSSVHKPDAIRREGPSRRATPAGPPRPGA